MAKETNLDDLWRSAAHAKGVFRPEEISNLPEAARRYLEHAIAPGTPLASAVRLTMHGEIKLNKWCPFRAEEVISWERGVIWRANVRMNGLPVVGSDRLVDGEGGMRWKILKLFPVLAASGPDISRSAAGRFGAEAVWLPTALCRPDVSWTGIDVKGARARLAVQGYTIEVDLTVDDDGRLETATLRRWGAPGGGPFRDEFFGAAVEAERTFDGYTIPARLRVGWYYGTPRFETEGEFFRVTIDGAAFR